MDISVIQNTLSQGLFLDQSQYNIYRHLSGALIPGLFGPIGQTVPGVAPTMLMEDDVKAETFNVTNVGAQDKFNPVNFTESRAFFSDVGIKIDATFYERDSQIMSNILGINYVQRKMAKMIDALRIKFDHLCISNLLGNMPTTIENFDVKSEYSQFNFGVAEENGKQRYAIATEMQKLPLARYIPVNATYPSLTDAPGAETLAAEKLTVGKLLLAAEAMADIPGEKVVIVPEHYMYNLLADKRVYKLDTYFANNLNISSEIKVYAGINGITVIGIPKHHFPSFLGNVAHRVDRDNAGGLIEMLTTDQAEEVPGTSVDYAIMFVSAGTSPTAIPSMSIIEERNLYTYRGKDGAKLNSNEITQEEKNASTMSIEPYYLEYEGLTHALKVRFMQIYWFSRPRNNSIAVIELNPGMTRINNI